MPTTYYLRLFLRWALGETPFSPAGPQRDPLPTPRLLDWRSVSAPLAASASVLDVDDDGTEADNVVRLDAWRRA